MSEQELRQTMKDAEGIVDGSIALSIHLLEGNREMANQNRTLGLIDLVGIPPAPGGIPQIEVTFCFAANGDLHMSAKDMGTGKKQKIRIKRSLRNNEQPPSQEEE